MWQVLDKPPQRVIINRAEEYIRPIIGLVNQNGNEAYIIQENENFSLYITYPVGFFLYKSIEYWFIEAIIELNKYLEKKKKK